MRPWVLSQHYPLQQKKNETEMTEALHNNQMENQKRKTG
jgi:hypothetical protein